MEQSHHDFSKQTLAHVSEFLTVPGAEVIIQASKDKPMKLSELIGVLMRAGAERPDRKVEFYICFRD